MAKREKVDQQEVAANALDVMLEEQMKFFNSEKLDVFTIQEAEQKFVGIPLPAFSLMYLFEGNVLPLSKIIGIAGAPQSYKSALGYEIQRWIMNAGGVGYMVETEAEKYSTSLMRTIFGNKEYSEKRFKGFRVGDIEAAQGAMSSIVKFYRSDEQFKKLLGALTIDSLTGADTEGASEDIMMENGFAKQDFSRMALLWSKYMRPFSNSLVGLPLVCVLINHLKVKVDPNARPGQAPGKTVPGGDAQRFSAAYYFYTYRSDSKERKTYLLPTGERIPRQQEIRTLKIQCNKSSMGVEGRDIMVDLVWYYDTEGNQVTYFDWEAATVQLLLSEQNMINTYDPTKKLVDLIDIKVSSASNATVYGSNALGVDKMEAHELGKLIHANEPLMLDLQKFFHIKQHKLWTGMMPEV